VDAALALLQNPRAELAQADPNKGGHRERGLASIDQAIGEVRAGIAFAAGHWLTQLEFCRQQGRTAGPGLFISMGLCPGYTDLTISSVIFLASPKSIIVLSR
jgi:hypothetical protein